MAILKNSMFYLVLLLWWSKEINCLKILAVLPTVGKSHWFVGISIAKTLVEAGHKVTVISPFPLQNPPTNLNDINLDGLLELAEEKVKSTKFDPANIPDPLMMYILDAFGLELSDYIFQHPNVVKLLNDENEKFDLVLVEFFATPTLIAFGEHFSAPVIGFSTSGSSKWTHETTGNTAPLSYVPNLFGDSSDRMTFRQRLYNTVLVLLDNFYSLLLYRSQQQVYEKYFPNSKLTYSEMIKKGVSAVFFNTHFSLNPIAPHLPNTIEIAGIHIDREIKPLSEDLKSFIDSAKHGVIYFALGTNIKSDHMQDKTQQAFVKAFSLLEQKVIWKFEKLDIENLPENVMICNWCPQNEILAHPNVKLFISHGGLLSLIETVYHGKPIIGIPYFGDQKVNIAFAEEKGFGYRLNPKDLTFESISKALATILSNQSYVENMKRVSSIYHDQPMTPQEKVVYWVEYVVRHKGAPHLQSAGQELNFIEYHMLDVFSFILIVTLLTISIILFCLRFIYRKIFTKKTKIE